MIQKVPISGENGVYICNTCYIWASLHTSTHGELAWTHVARTLIFNAFLKVALILYFYAVHHGLQMPPQVKKSSGLKSGDVRSHSMGQRQSIQWPANCLSSCARKFHSMCMETFESSCTVTITGLYDPQTTATEYVSIWPNVKLLWSGSWEMGKVTRRRSCDPKQW